MEATGGVGAMLSLPGAVKRVWDPQSGAFSLNWKVRTWGACESVLDTERKCGSQSGRGPHVRFRGLSLTGETHPWTRWIHQCPSTPLWGPRCLHSQASPAPPLQPQTVVTRSKVRKVLGGSAGVRVRESQARPGILAK